MHGLGDVIHHFPPVVKVEGWTMLAPQKSQVFPAWQMTVVNLDFSEAPTKMPRRFGMLGCTKGGRELKVFFSGFHRFEGLGLPLKTQSVSFFFGHGWST